MQNTVSTKLYDLLVTKNLSPKLLDANGKPISDPENADIMSFDFKTPSKNHGTVVVLINNDQLEVFYSDNIDEHMDDQDQSYWYDFLKQLKNLATRNLLTFSAQNLNRLKYTMQSMAAIKEGLFETFYGNRKVSYSLGPNDTKMIIKHNRPMEEDQARHHAIHSIFIETAQGERFKVPSRNLTHARMLQRHIAEGGSPYDTVGQYINQLMNNIGTLSKFLRAVRARDLNPDAVSLVSEVVKHYGRLKSKAKKMVSQRGYMQELQNLESESVLTDASQVSTLRSMFSETVIDSRIEEALPLLSRLSGKEMRESQMFEQWAQDLSEGTWNLPDTPQQLESLRTLMSDPLPVGPDASNATEQLYDLLGDDRLFDMLQDLAQKDADADARPVIVKRLQELGLDLGLDQDQSAQPSSTKEDLDTDGVMMTKPSNMSSESKDFSISRLRLLAAV